MAIRSHTAKDDAANARTLANQAQDLLRRDILSGTLAPGEHGARQVRGTQQRQREGHRRASGGQSRLLLGRS